MKVIDFVKNAWAGKATPWQAVLIIFLLIVPVRIISAVIAAQISDPHLIEYSRGNLVPTSMGYLEIFLITCPFTVWAYVSCWRSSKKLKHYSVTQVAIKVLVALLVFSHVAELLNAIKVIVF